MRGRVGVVVVVCALFAAGIAAGAIHAGPTTPPTTTETTSTDATTTTTTTAATTTTIQTVPTTATIPTTTATRAPVGTAIVAGPPPNGCLVVAAFALLEPGGRLLVLGPAAHATRARSVAAQHVGYPADGSIVSASSIDLRAAGCSDSGRGRAEVRSISLFGGAIAARRVELGVRGGVAGAGSAVAGLTVGGKTVALRPGRAVRVQDWGSVVALARPDRAQAGALAVSLSKSHAGLPAGTVLLVSFAHLARPKAVPHRKAHAARPHAVTHSHRKRKAPKRRHRRHAPKHQLGDAPLTVTPPLGVNHYVFPVAGNLSFGDSYGGYRGDVPGNWHHGDDLFAPVGTPVLAVADGTLNRVGWEHLGGWRLWVRDAMRNEFYYAHLSGYSPLALHSRHVYAGDVIGFVGNTGDAFTTPSHLHFEVHPHQLLRLDYNGAVNPTGYLESWHHQRAPHPLKPAHPPFPRGAVRAEAKFVWRQLLAVRGLISHAPKASERPRIRIPRPDVVADSQRTLAAAGPRAEQTHTTPVVDVLAGLIAPSAAFCLTLLLRLRRKP